MRSLLMDSCKVRDDYEKRKKERKVENQKLVQRREELIAERRRLLAEREGDVKASGSNVSSRQSNNSLGKKVGRAKIQIPQVSGSFQALKEEEDRKKKLLQVPYEGELGIGSYEPWQLEDFKFVRGFIECWLDEVLDFIIYDPSGVVERVQTIVERFHREIEAVEESELFNKVVNIEYWSILEEVTESLCFNVAVHCFTLHNQAKVVTDQMVIGAVTNYNGFNTFEQTEVEEKQNLILSAYNQLRKEREKQFGIWTHNQKLSLHGQEFNEESEEVEDIFDGTVLHFHNVVPFDDVPDGELPLEFLKFREEESRYWMGKEPMETSLPLNKRYRGVSCASVSPSHTLIAFGTVQGDMTVWDLRLYPPRILRSLKGNVTIVNISWSMDSCQLLTITENGTVQLWSLIDTQTVTFSVKAFEPSEPNTMFKTSTLQNLLTLELQHLYFTKGPFTESRQLISRPVKAAFYPSFSFLASQNSIVLGLENGNILKLNLNSELDEITGPQPRLAQPKSRAEIEVGLGIKAELFRGHENSIIHISFIENISSMVTVDSKGFVYLWEYSEEYLTGFNWFSPKQKFRLDMTEVTYTPIPGAQEKVEFTDKVKGKGKRFEINKEEMIKKRRDAQTYINSMFLGAPWLTEEKGNIVYNVYAPKTVPEAGATFHLVSYYKSTGLLAQYATQLYKPVKVPCSRLITCVSNPLGTKLVFMLLFPKNSPKEPHVTFVILHLPDMTVSRNLIEATVTPDDLKEAEKPGTCSLSITKPLIATGTDYIIANIAGSLCGFSMETGNTVLAETEKDWIGSHMSSKQSHVLSTAGVVVASLSPNLQFLIFARRLNFVSLFHLYDKSTGKQILTTWEKFKQWQNLKNKSLCRRQQMWTRSQWTLSGRTDIHVECSVETLVLNLVDQAIQIVDGQFTAEKAEACASENREMPFVLRAEKLQRLGTFMPLSELSRQSTQVSLFSNQQLD